MGENDRPAEGAPKDLHPENMPETGMQGETCADAAPHGPGCDGKKPEGACPPPHGPRRAGAGRLTAYLLLTVLMNVLFAVYALYILGISMEAVSEILAVGRVESMPRLILLVLIMVSPLLLTIFGNRILYAVMRGRRRFPRGIWFFAILLIIAVQALTFYVAFTAGAAPALETFTVESFTTGGF